MAGWPTRMAAIEHRIRSRQQPATGGSRLRRGEDSGSVSSHLGLPRTIPTAEFATLRKGSTAETCCNDYNTLNRSSCKVAEMDRVGIAAISLDAETVNTARKNKYDILKDVAACKWSIVVLSPERLSSPEFDTKVMRNDTFRRNLVNKTVDEVHVVVPWLETNASYDGYSNRRAPPGRIP